ncbi:PilZ domain-containing protein [Croceicoccus mobilis]|jgi:hypothetical protein|uniref:PilZ domain-containing protein n=1 Tax=Croceicoccus mobilis TaxID=1703339 RepID=UPI00082D35F6
MFIARLHTEKAVRDGRSRARRTVRVEVEAKAASSGSPAIIRNLSETGLLLETRAALRPGETLHIDLPISGECAAEIVWIDGVRHGCRFLLPIPKATVSAAELISPFLDQPTEGQSDDSQIDLEFEEMLSRGEKSWRAANIALLLLLVTVAAFIVGLLKATL